MAIKHTRFRKELKSNIKTFTLKKGLDTHMQTVHNENKPKNDYKCDFCEYAAPSAYILKNHRDSVHFKKVFHKCSLCEKTFTTKSKSDLNTHMATAHNSERNFKIWAWW